MQSNPAKLYEAKEELEQRKFDLDEDGNVIVRTSTKGEIRPAGLTKDFKVTTMTVNDIVTAIPLTPLVDRNAISIHNKGTETVFIGKIDVTPDSVNGFTSGWELDGGSYLNFDITESIVLYGICQVGKSVQLKILELA